MALVNSSFTVNVTPGAMPPIVHVSEYDVGRTYTVTINGENGSVFNIPTGTTATVEGTLNGVIGFNTDATVSGSTVSFTLTESMTAKSGKAWCKIKLTLNDEPIQTCAFILAVDRAGVEADTVIGADGFDTQIVNAVNDWLDEHPPASGGMSEAFKQALLDCFENVAWINDDGQTYYDALYAALYPPVDVLFISAVFNQGSAVIYNTDSLDTLKQYLTVTATMSDSTTRTVTNYTLSGTLAVGTSTITVSYGGKTTTFNVTVTHEILLPDAYQQVEYLQSSRTQYINTGLNPGDSKTDFNGYSVEITATFLTQQASGTAVLIGSGVQPGCWMGAVNSGVGVGLGASIGTYYNDIDPSVMQTYTLSWANNTLTAVCQNSTISRSMNSKPDNRPFTVFSNTTMEYPGDFRVSRVKIAKNGTPLRDLIACYRKSDDVIGMYDIVNDAFYTNAGTGTFTKGSDV